MKVFNKKSTEVKRRNLKKDMTKAEKILWEHISCDALGVRFRRQYGIGEYIVDFYCPKLKLVIEKDGVQHYSEDGLEYDKIREEFMGSLGIRTIRVKNKEVIENIDGVVRTLLLKVPSLPKDPK